MGYTTDFVGYVDITPRLNRAETEYLTAFSKSRRYGRPGGPYEVPANPYAGVDDVPVESFNRPPVDQPSLWCDWVPSMDGQALAFNGKEKFYRPVEWLRYLIQHFLKPGALASRSTTPWFTAFTFDHECNGLLVGCRRDTGEIFGIRATRNRVTKSVLWK